MTYPGDGLVDSQSYIEIMDEETEENDHGHL